MPLWQACAVLSAINILIVHMLAVLMHEKKGVSFSVQSSGKIIEFCISTMLMLHF